MRRTVILQSHRFQVLRGWIGRCVDSVRSWAETNSHDYRFEGDEIFSRLPDDYRAKLAGKLPIQADLARLLWVQSVLADGYDQALWLDADVLIFAPDRLSLEGYGGDCAFGCAFWVDQDKNGQLTLWKTIHNAACLFPRGDPTLPFLIRTVQRIIQDTDAEHIAPRMVGPKLLTALDGIAGFGKLNRIGAFSPLVLKDIAAGEGPALCQIKTAMKDTNLSNPAAANLCASLIDANIPIDAVINRLLDKKGLP